MPNPFKVEILSIQLILAGPLGSSNDQAGDLLGSQLLSVNDDIEIAAIVAVDSVELKISFPILLISLQRAVQDRLVG